MVKKESTPDWEALFLSFKQNIYPEMVELLAEQLGVSVDVLNRLEVGWHPGEQAWVTREFDDRGNIVGLQKRYKDGKKFMVEGSKRGLVYECVGKIIEQRNSNRGNNAQINSRFIRAYTLGVDCPLCGKKDWCLLSGNDPHNPTAVICGRTEQGAIRYIENSGYLHHLHAISDLGSQISCLFNSQKPYLVVEGFSDVAAATNMGRVAVGKPNAESGHSYLSSLLRKKDVIVVGENDEAGRRGMVKTFNTLRPVCRSVKKVLPPPEFKDLRQWHPTADIFDQWVNNQSEQADNSQMIETVDFNLLAERWLANFKEPLIYFFEDWYKFDGVCYRVMQRGWLQAQVREFFRGYEIVEYRGKNTDVKPLQVNTYFVSEIEAALKCLCRTDMKTRTDRPFWIGV